MTSGYPDCFAAVGSGPCTRVLGMGEGPSQPGEGGPFCDSLKAILWLTLALGTGKQYSRHEGVAGPGQWERKAVVSYPREHGELYAAFMLM